MIALYYLKNIIEIFFFSSIVYSFSLWLKKDKQFPLLLYFYGYFILFSVTFFLDFSTVNLFLLYSSPFVLFLFIIFHEETLQRNFVALTHTKTDLTSPVEQWLENLIRICLHHMNNNVSLHVVLEHSAELKPFIKSNYIFNSPLSLDLLSLITESPHFDHHKIVWCNTSGTLIGINSFWQFDAIHQKKSALTAWQQDALLITLKTDTIVFKVNHHNRCFEIITKGILYESVNTHHIVSFIKKHLNPTTQQLQKGEINHDNTHLTQKQPPQQPHP